MNLARLLRQLNHLKDAIDRLEYLGDDTREDIDGIFEKHPAAHARVHGLIEAATHNNITYDIEMFGGEIDLLARFFAFQNEFANYDADLIAGIAAPGMATQEARKRLLELGFNPKEALDLIQHMRQRWSEVVGGEYSSRVAFVEAVCGMGRN